MKKIIALVIILLIIFAAVLYFPVLLHHRESLMQMLAPLQQFQALATAFRLLMQILMACAGLIIVAMLLMVLLSSDNAAPTTSSAASDPVLNALAETKEDSHQILQRLKQLEANNQPEMAPAPAANDEIIPRLEELNREIAGIKEKLATIKEESNGHKSEEDDLENASLLGKMSEPESSYSPATIDKLNTMNKELRKARSIRNCLNILLKYASEITESQRASIFLLSQNKENIYLVKSLGWEPQQEISVPVGDGIAGRVAASNEQWLIENIDDLAEFSFNEERYNSKSFISTPIITGKTTIGVLNLTEKNNGKYNQDDGELLAVIMDQISLALENLLLIKKISKT
jgi:putative methionine-R-sulfoxide reductase with GAF domain